MDKGFRIQHREDRHPLLDALFLARAPPPFIPAARMPPLLALALLLARFCRRNRLNSRCSRALLLRCCRVNMVVVSSPTLTRDTTVIIWMFRTLTSVTGSRRLTEPLTEPPPSLAQLERRPPPAANNNPC